MQVYLYQNRVEETSEAIYIGLYAVHSTDARGFVNGTLMDLFNVNGEESISLVGRKTGSFIELWFLKNHAALIFDDGQELPTL